MLEQKGFTFEAYIPNADVEPVAFELRILERGVVKFKLLVPMTYVPTFGVDVGDIRYLESVLDRVVLVLPDAADIGTDHILALHKIENEIGGTRLRHQPIAREGPVNGKLGDFEYTAGLFVEKFAPLMGGAEVLDKWMREARPQLNGLTPEEALRLGMAQDVVEILLENAGNARQPSP
ncbi:hypothetical protein KK141_17335 [Dyella sp. LX-66]|nr:hypothetical protein [Dyella sp. LX-1]MBT2141313.1 hypothetical protein [Dyella sp. LX-66]